MTRGGGLVVALTGSSGYIGQRLVALLDADPRVHRIVGVDVRPPQAPPAKLVFVERDVRAPFADAFRGADVALHLAWILDPIRDAARMTAVNLGGSRNFLDACEANGVRRVLLLSSATAYGARPENPLALPETYPVAPTQAYQYGAEKAQMEALAREWSDAHADVEVTFARPSIVVGPHVGNFISRSMTRRVVTLIGGADPPMQMVHESDCARALAFLALDAAAGTYNIGADGTARPRDIAQRFGARVVNLPLPVARALVGIGWRLGLKAVAEAPPSILPFLRFPWVLDNRRLKAAGFVYHYDTWAALDTLPVTRA